jgi:hypothetical protein
MAITAFSKTFNREVDVKQLHNLHQKFEKDLRLVPDFRKFVESDIECSCCNISGARIVNEGVSITTQKIVKQAHFAFKGKNEGDSHLVFCDHYTGLDRQDQTTNDCSFKIRKSGNAITEIVRKYVCKAIEQGIFLQSDIRDMRQWFLSVRSREDFFIKRSQHHLSLLRETILRFENNKDQYIVDMSIVNSDLFDIDNEVYKSLAYKITPPKLPTDRRNLKHVLTRRAIVKKAISISIKDHGIYGFDRSFLEDKYILTTQLSMKIIDLNPLLKSKIGNSISKTRGNNPIMAYSAILLFISKWDIEKAYEKHILISNITSIKDENLGNIMGLNPFIHYDAWVALKFVSEWRTNLNDFDMDEEYTKEKSRLQAIYGIN